MDGKRKQDREPEGASSPALYPLAIQLAQERPPLRFVWPVQDPEEWYRESRAAAEVRWQEEHAIWLRESEELCSRQFYLEETQERAIGEEDVITPIPSDTHWIAWTLSYMCGRFVHAVVDAYADLLLRQAPPPEQALARFDAFSVRLVNETIEYKWRTGGAGLYPYSDGVLAQQFDAEEQDWRDPHGLIRPIRAELEKLLWAKQAQNSAPEPAAIKYDSFIQNEPLETQGQSARYRWASETVKLPDQMAIPLQPSVVMDSEVQNQGATIPDVQLQSAVKAAEATGGTWAESDSPADEVRAKARNLLRRANALPQRQECECLVQNKLSRNDIARVAGCCVRTFFAYQAGESWISTEIVKAIAQTLEKTPEDFLKAAVAARTRLVD